MISVVICTYNRVSALEKCLQSFEKIQFDHAWELLIVDNNSSDGTSDFVSRYIAQSRLPLRICNEKQQGLGHARNTGLRESKYPIIAYTDDDCYPEPDYLQRIIANFEDENISFLGGRVLLYDPDDLDLTVQYSNEVKYYHPNSRILAGEIHGANFAFRKELLQKVKGFDPLFGAGTALKSCEDIDTLAECLRHGASGKYSPDIVVHHHHGRKTRAEYDSLMRGYNIGRGAFYVKRILFCAGQRFRYAKYWFYSMRHQPFSWTKVEIGAAFMYFKLLIQKNRNN